MPTHLINFRVTKSRFCPICTFFRQTLQHARRLHSILFDANVSRHPVLQNKVLNVCTGKIGFAQRVRKGNSHFCPSQWHTSRYATSRPLKT